MSLAFLWGLTSSAAHVYALFYKGDGGVGGPAAHIAVHFGNTSVLGDVIWQHITSLGSKFLTSDGRLLYRPKDRRDALDV